MLAIHVFVIIQIVLVMSSEISPIPHNLNALRACKLCKLIKNYDEVGMDIVNQQMFLHNGCENCDDILHMAGDDERVREMTSPYFDGYYCFY